MVDFGCLFCSSDCDTCPRGGSTAETTRESRKNQSRHDWKQRREVFRRLASSRASPRLGYLKAFSSDRSTPSPSPAALLSLDWPWPPSFPFIILSFFSPLSSSPPLTFLTILTLTTPYTLIIIRFPGRSPAGHVVLHHNPCPPTASLLSGLTRHPMYPPARTGGGAIRMTSLAS